MAVLTPEIKQYIDKSILCWLATASLDGMPNVSPKEIFTYFDHDLIIIANIASPRSVKNIQENPNVCLSFIDILVQKGYQLKGTAQIVDKDFSLYLDIERALTKMTGELFKFNTATIIRVTETKPILAPSYLFYPETTEADQIRKAKIAYGLYKATEYSD